MKLIFVHGWSVTHTNTYGAMPESLARRAAEKNLQLDISHIHLGRYISFHDEVTLDDIARALDCALRELPGNEQSIAPFSCITHSTGGPVVRHWVERYYGARGLGELPLVHLVMLAPANHGSSLGVLGKKRVGRIKSWFSGIEPGQRVLDWLSLGSEGQWELNEACLRYKPAQNGFYPFVLTGQGIDTKFYDFINNYLTEEGSDGVVRVSGANMNYRYLSLLQTEEPVSPGSKTLSLVSRTNQAVRRPPVTPLGVFHDYSHSGSKMGIMGVSTKQDNHDRIVSEILACLSVESADTYGERAEELLALTEQEQGKKPVGQKDTASRYSMLIFRIRDQSGQVLEHDDFDVLLLGGPRYKENKLPPGFFKDRQLNKTSNALVYYVDTDALRTIEQGLFGIRVIARPEKGFSHYNRGEFRSEGLSFEKAFAPNEVTYIDITLLRQVDRNVFRFSPANAGRESFKNVKPSGKNAD
jgi:hypothetical protein